MDLAVPRPLFNMIMILLFSSFLPAQQANYESSWLTVTKFENDGLIQSALKTVEGIAAQSKADKNNVQHIKTLLYKSKYALTLEKDAQLNIVRDFNTEIAAQTAPTKNLLESVLANLYWHYFNQNKWKFYNRTKTETKVNPEDFRTWDLETLFLEIHQHHQNALQNGLLLQLEPLKKYDALLQTQKASKIYRPTLFDFLSHNALEFYKTPETHITRPAYKFEINHPNALAPATAFSVLELSSKDSTALQLQALKIYKNLIRFHLKNNNLDALTDVNLQRLKFVVQHATFNNAETHFLKTLNAEKQVQPNTKTAALYDFEIAKHYHKQSEGYIPLQNETERWKAKQALDLCNTIIAQFPNSHAAKKSTVLKAKIESQSLEITSESQHPVQQKGRLLLRYKNIEKVTFNIYKLSKSQFEKFKKTYPKEEKWAYIQKRTPSQTWSDTLKNEFDYQIHTTEVVHPKLDNGRYLIVATTALSDASNFWFSQIQITNLAVIERETPTYKTFQLIDRRHGKPVVNTPIQVSYYKRNAQQTSKENITTNHLGEIQLKKAKHSRKSTINLEVKEENTTAYFGSYYLNQLYLPSKQKPNYNAFIFTDRSLYRPGQTLYFKAIAVKKTKAASQLLNQSLFTVSLHNKNNETLKTLKLKTNDYGAISGTFILPKGGLNGQYRISVSSASFALNNSHYFAVEDYKRPKFETKFTPVKATYKINDTVYAKGQALAYAGSVISDAKVVYRVVRKVQYPLWYFWSRPYLNQQTTQEIAHGSTMTNANGHFTIPFKALPDASVSKDGLPVFQYEITADVTDLNGETRSATQYIFVGYHALRATLAIAPRLNKTKKGHLLSIKTTNLNGEFTPTKGTIKIYKLKAPDAVLRPRPWPAPDYQTISKVNFKQWFPHEAYTNEDRIDQRQKGSLVFEQDFNTKMATDLKLDQLKKWESGHYSIVFETKDQFGQVVKDEVKTVLFSPKDKTLADNERFSITSNKTTYTVGDQAKLTLASAAKNLTVTIAIEKDKTLISKQIITLNTSKKTISIPITKADLGGFVVHYSFAAFNNFQSGVFPIAVPYPKTELELETLTFRNKLQPGTDETWAFKIKGPHGETISAELLASMYDASLDQFKPHQWQFSPNYKPNYNAQSYTRAQHSFGTTKFTHFHYRNPINYPQLGYDQLNWFGFYFGNSYRHFNTRYQGVALSSKQRSKRESVSTMIETDLIEDLALEEEIAVGFGAAPQQDTTAEPEKASETTPDIAQPNNINIRRNLQETAFFFPHLKTDAKGHVSFSFTTPEALTQWKLQLLAHTTALNSSTTALTAITQKELMVIPNVPRFLRAGDTIHISTKIANLSDAALTGTTQLLLTDAISGKDISVKLLQATKATQPFVVDAAGNTAVTWQLKIPHDIQAVQYKIIAQSGTYSDGEQNVLPVLTNRMLVTETLPMWVKSNATKTFTLSALKNTNSTTLKHHKLSLEVTSNPAWYAVQALPYLMEYPYDCNEQTFSKYYANALAQHVANSNPRIKNVFQQWRSSSALLSQLEKNQELKSILIQETPWLRDAKSETEQKKRIALLFDLNTTTYETETALRKLKANQMASGAWSWFKGGYANRYITQHIIAGFGHLKQLQVKNTSKHLSEQLIRDALRYLDQAFIDTYKELTKRNAKVNLDKDHLSEIQLHYLYMRSFFPDIPLSAKAKSVAAYYQTQIDTYWLKRSLYAKGLMALISYRSQRQSTCAKILNALKETSITSEELGMYWKSNTNSWYWHQAPIETQALLIEAFSEAGHSIQTDTQNLEIVDNLKIWLLKHKQTNRWKTTKATSEAIYALLLQGSDWLAVNDMADVTIGQQKVTPTKDQLKVEAGTGYYKTTWNGNEITPEMGSVRMHKTGKGIAWAGLYWQYFEDLDKINHATTPLQLRKKLFLKRYTDTGETLFEITPSTPLKIGDLIRVRIELRSDRAMQFIHMKDMRAAGLEPLNVLSHYKWQDGLGYYESTKDAATHFFFDNLPKGIYIFEYDLRVNNVGHMSNGITTIQSMYAPEFSSHSKGSRVRVTP